MSAKHIENYISVQYKHLRGIDKKKCEQINQLLNELLNGTISQEDYFNFLVVEIVRLDKIGAEQEVMTTVMGVLSDYIHVLFENRHIDRNYAAVSKRIDAEFPALFTAYFDNQRKLITQQVLNLLSHEALSAPKEACRAPDRYTYSNLIRLINELQSCIIIKRDLAIDSETINEIIFGYNVLLSIFQEYRRQRQLTLSGSYQWETEVADKIRPLADSKKTYSTLLILDYGFGHMNFEPRIAKWKENNLVNDVIYKDEIEHTIDVHDTGVIDNHSKVIISGHGGPGLSWMESDGIFDEETEEVSRQKVTYQELAKNFVDGLSHEQLSSLQDKTASQKITFVIGACNGGKGLEAGGLDSFAARFHRELKEQYGIYSEVRGYTLRRWPAEELNKDLTFTRALGYTAVHGSGDAVKAANLRSRVMDNKKKHEDKEFVDSHLLKKQPGSKVAFVWNADDEQVRLDGYQGGKYRADIYEAITKSIDRNTKLPKKIAGLNNLLRHLASFDSESEMVNSLSSIVKSGKKGDIYHINTHRDFSFFRKTQLYSELKAIIKRYDQQTELSQRHHISTDRCAK